MVKTIYFGLFNRALTPLVWCNIFRIVLALDVRSLYSLSDQQLLNVNASWPSGAKFMGQDCCDGNWTDPTSLSQFLDGPPTITLKVSHDDVYPASFMQATKDSLLSSKYIVMITLYNQSEVENDQYEVLLPIWMQGNMTASTPDGKISNNNTVVTLSNSTEALLSYSADFDVSVVDYNLRFDQTLWQMSVGVYQQTPELENILYTKDLYGHDPKQNRTLLYRRFFNLFFQTYHGTMNPSDNLTAPTSWGRIYGYVPGIYDKVSTPSTPSATGDISTPSSTSSALPAATTSHAAATRQHIYGGANVGTVLLFIWTILAVLAGVFI